LVDAQVLRFRSPSSKHCRVVQPALEDDDVWMRRSSFSVDGNCAYAGRTAPARLSDPRGSPLADERLRKPERGSLLSNSIGAIEQIGMMNVTGR
jgi:hypothetical protein